VAGQAKKKKCVYGLFGLGPLLSLPHPNVCSICLFLSQRASFGFSRR